MDFRIGQGYDVHALAEGLPMVLGGVRIPSQTGFVAHSDGDVAIHALCDALLGALALGDIGHLFPDTDERWKGVDSTELLAAVLALPAYRGWTVDKTRVTIKGWTTASADFQGCNFYEIAKFIRDNGHDVPDDIPAGMALSSISFTGTEKILFAYTDGTGDAGEFRFNGSSFTYRWDDEKMGFTFLTDQATVEYMDGKCILTISASIQDSTTSGSVTFVLSPMA